MYDLHSLHGQYTHLFLVFNNICWNHDTVASDQIRHVCVSL